jgi:hypothetical protein
MVDAFNEHRKRFQEQLIIESAGYHYRFSRHHLFYSIALIYVAEADIDFTTFKKYLRTSDQITLLQEDLCAIVLDGTNEDQGIKAAENLLAQLQNICFTKHLYMAVVTVNSNDTEFQTVHDLFDLLSYALNHNMDNSVIEYSQVMKND